MKNRKNSKNKHQPTYRFTLTLLYSLLVFLLMLISIGMAYLVAYIFIRVGIISDFEDALASTTQVMLLMSSTSIVFGVGLSFLTSKIQIRPFDRLIVKMSLLASGRFDTRLKYYPPLSWFKAYRELEDKFNSMAEELQSTEMLREDFVNNFSHEFKTPIVSIAGFAKLLKRGNLTEEQKLEYINVIEEESMRLSYMATNVLNMTKVENRTILTDVTTFNLSEQIRSSVLLLETKWAKKNIDFDMEFNEYYIQANEELLKQVWINLIDNAIKFSPHGKNISIRINNEKGTYCVSIENKAEDIPEEKLSKLFNKFYQADESHASQGNGVGLAIVKKVIELHDGTVTAESRDGVVRFDVFIKEKRH